MNTRNIFTSVIVIILLSGAIYLYLNINTIKNKINDAFNTEQLKVLTKVNFNAIFIIFDPSGSGTSAYAVPRLTVENTNNIIDNMLSSGSGELWLTYIDKEAWNNKVLHLFIPEKPQPPQIPTRNSGEAKYKFNNRIEQFEKDSLEYQKNMEKFNQRFNDAKRIFLSDCNIMLQKGYAKKKIGEDYSDVIGSINSAQRSLSTIPSDSQHFRSVLLISDGVQDLPSGVKSQKLNDIPKDICIVTVNNSGSKNNVIGNKTIEVDNLDRALQYIIRQVK